MTSGTRVHTKGNRHSKQQYDRGEADKRPLVYVTDLMYTGCITCLVCTVDTDVVVFLIGMFLHLSARIWVAFDKEKDFTYLHVTICHALGNQKKVYSYL